MRVTNLWVPIVLLPTAALGHHSFSAVFDQTKTIELEGELSEIRWQNPHILLTVEVRDDDGAETAWTLESLSANGVSRTGVTAELFVVGDRIKVAGNPARRGANQVWVTNVLLPSGRELVMGGAQRQPRWSQEILRASETAQESAGVAADAERGVFGVWSSNQNFRTRLIGIENAADPLNFPLTPAGRTRVESGRVEDDPTVNCVPKGMPRIMTQPYPIEFVRQSDTIVLKIEEYDVVRTIHTGADADSRATLATPSPLGYSTGRFDDRTLIVTTTKLASGSFDGGGGGRIRLSADATLVERFSPSTDGARLDYRLIITDPPTLTAPVTLEKFWIHLPGVQVLPFDCQR